MSTLTALHTRNKEIIPETVTIEVVQALPEDLKELHKSIKNGENIMKLRVGMVYWLKSSITQKFEPTPRIITKEENLDQINEWLKFKMIYVAKNSFQ